MTFVSKPGIDIYEVNNSDEGYGEVLSVTGSLSNGLRFNIKNDDIDYIAHFHIKSKEVALEIANTLIAMAGKKWPV